MKTCLIISGGEFSHLPEDFTYDFCIACDAGLTHAEKLNIKPDLILGDFDSYLGEKPDSTEDTPVYTYPIEKDDTDTMLAIKHALNHGYEKITIVCALGARLDHTIANVQSLSYIASKGFIGEIISDTEHLLTFTGGEIVLPKIPETSLSLFSLTDRCEGLSIQGAKYEVIDAILENTFPLGVSNKWEKDEVTISMKSGILLIVMSNMSKEKAK